MTLLFVFYFISIIYILLLYFHNFKKDTIDKDGKSSLHFDSNQEHILDRILVNRPNKNARELMSQFLYPIKKASYKKHQSLKKY